jgi:membrane protein required for colicin V production
MIDIVFVIILIMAVFKGFTRGFIVALFSVIALIVGLAAAMKLSAVTAAYLEKSLDVSARWLAILSFILVFLAAAFLVRLGAKAIEKTFQMAMLGWVNRLLGIILYFVLYLVIFSVVLFYVEKIGLLSATATTDSTTYNFIKPWGPAAIDALGFIIPFFKNMFTELGQFFDRVKN